MKTKMRAAPRTMFRKVSKSGSGLVGGLAARQSERDASSAQADCLQGCCNLVYCNTCGVSGPACEQVPCPAPNHLESWQCWDGPNHYWICYECTTGSNCYSGSFHCSQARPSDSCN